MSTIALRTGFLLLLLAALTGCAGNNQHTPKDNADRNTRLANLKKALQLPWGDDGSCAVREASSEWVVLVEKCFHALDLQKISFEASTGKCAVYAGNLTALGTCLLAAVPEVEPSVALSRMAGPPIALSPMAALVFAPPPVWIVAGVVVVGVVAAPYIVKAITELVEYYQDTRPVQLANPEQLKPQPQVEARPKPELVIDGSLKHEPRPDPARRGRPGPEIVPVPPSPEPKEREKKLGRIYVTYWKLNKKTNLRYAGRTSMVMEIDFDRCLSMSKEAEYAVAQRDQNHHVEDQEPEPKDPAYTLARYDQHDCGKAVNYTLRDDDLAYRRIRGREQFLIDAFGGARSDTGEPFKTDNKIRGVARDNERGREYYRAAVDFWGGTYGGEKVEYTGSN